MVQYAAVMGLQKDLKLQNNDLSNVATFLFVALLVFSIPNGKPNLAHTLGAHAASLPPSSLPSRQVARRKRRAVGRCYSLWRRCA
jgi:hypothetical protein